MSNREAVKNEIKERWEDVLKMITTRAPQNVNGRPSYICPLCGNGSGEHGDGITFNPASKAHGLKCFKCHFEEKNGGDIIDLVQQKYGWSFDQALDTLAGWLNIPIDPKASQDFKNDAGAAKNPPPLSDYSETEKTPENENIKPPRDFSIYLEECRQRLEDPAAVEYLNSRGISLGTARSFGVGYDPGTGGGYKDPRLILPASCHFFAARLLREPLPGEKRYLNGGNAELFNPAPLADPQAEAVFIVEGAIDAMAIHEAGGQAVALNSTSNKKLLIDYLQHHQLSKDATLLLALDKDAGGEKCSAELQEALTAMKINYIVVDIAGKYKDAAEHLAADPASFEKAVKLAIKKTKARPDNTADYVTLQRLDDCEAYRQKVPTGLKNLDEMSGGLRPGLYVLAAISSLGKTTLAHQIAENVAARGYHVLFFSMEQSTNELVSKSLRRIIDSRNPASRISTLEIMEGGRDFPILEAEKIYVNTIGQNLSIIEGNFDCTIDTITEYVKRYIRKNGVKPLVIVDYLQILQPGLDKLGRRQTTKETVDVTVTELKRLSRAQGLPVLAISSVNRMNYTLPVDFEALKESGNIEFTADVIYGLQLHVIQDPDFIKEESIVKKREIVKQEKAKLPRELDLVCLKNRFGISSFTCHLKYHSNRDFFEPWEMSFQEKWAQYQRAEHQRQALDADADRKNRKRGGRKKAAGDKDTGSPWPELAAPKQQELVFSEIITGRMIDTEGRPINMIISNAGGQRWPVVLDHQDEKGEWHEDYWILSEAQYNGIIEYNRKNNPDFEKQTKIEPGGYYPF